MSHLRLGSKSGEMIQRGDREDGLVELMVLGLLARPRDINVIQRWTLDLRDDGVVERLTLPTFFSYLTP